MASENSFPSPHGFIDYHKPKTRSELRIMLASQLIRERKGWRESMKSKYEEEVIKNWREVAISRGLKTEEFNCVLEQLKHYDGLTIGLVEVAAVDDTWQADNLVCDQLKSKFMKAVDDLLYKPDKKDYAPRTDNLVVNLIDPSLYCFVSDVSRRKFNAIPSLRYIGGGTRLEVPRGRCGGIPKVEYKMLPAEFHIDATGKVTINSYINNLHPVNHRRLYPLIAEIFECFIPLFNGVLNDLRSTQATIRSTEKPKEEQYVNDLLHSLIMSDQLRMRSERNTSSSFKRRTVEKDASATTKYDLKGHDIQVIVKLKCIELTPKKPEFKGGDWHIEGVANEHIVATGIYCYHTENVTDSRLYFRQNDGKNQELGAIVTSEDRLLAFPNICQHRVDSFELVDKTKVGFRKILVFFLIDPTWEITSTKNVPPQQMSWFNEELRKIPHFDLLDWYTLEYITSFLEWPMSSEKAKKYREKFLAERTIDPRGKSEWGKPIMSD